MGKIWKKRIAGFLGAAMILTMPGIANSNLSISAGTLEQSKVVVLPKLGQGLQEEGIKTGVDKENPNIRYTYDGSTKTLTVSGNGIAKEIELEDISSVKCYLEDKVDRLIVKDGVEEIGDEMFSYFKYKSISLPNSVKKIGKEAFYANINLKEVTIPDSVITIGDGAFEGCSNMEKLNIGKGLADITSGTFRHCSKLADILINEENNGLAFKDGVLFSKDMTKLYIYLPTNDRESYVIPDEVTTIYDDAFGSCWNSNGIKSVTLGKSVKDIGEKNYSLHMADLTEIKVSEENENFKSVNGVLYSKDGKKLIQYPEKKTGDNYAIGSDVTSIAYGAFERNSFIKKVSMTDSVTEIGGAAFCYCRKLADFNLSKNIKVLEQRTLKSTSLTSLVVPEGVTTIYDAALAWNHFDKLVLPSTLKKVGIYAFYCDEDEPWNNNVYYFSKDFELVMDEESENYKSLMEFINKGESPYTFEEYKLLYGIGFAKNWKIVEGSKFKDYLDLCEFGYTYTNSNEHDTLYSASDSGTTSGTTSGSTWRPSKPTPSKPDDSTSSDDDKDPSETNPSETPGADLGSSETPGTDQGNSQTPGSDQGTGQTPGADQGTGQNPGTGQTPGADQGTGQNTDVSTTQTNQPTQNAIPDGTTVVQNPDGSVIETVVATNTDGSRVETVTTKNTDGTTKEVKVETSSTGAVVKTTTDTKADGSKVKVVEEKALNSAGKETELTTTVRINSDGSIKSVAERTVIPQAAKNTKVEVFVVKDEDGELLRASATILCMAYGGRKVKFDAGVYTQINEAVGSPVFGSQSARIAADEGVLVSLTARDESGKTLYTIKADTSIFTPGESLYLYKVNKNSDDLTMATSKKYKVEENGNVELSIANKATYKLVSKAEAKEINNKIRATFKAKKSSIKLKTGKTVKFALKAGALTDNVKRIEYSSSKTSVAKVSSKGKITAKKAGKTTITAKIIFTNGSTKTVKSVVKVF